MRNVLVLFSCFFCFFCLVLKTEAQVYNWDLGNHPQNITTKVSGFSGTKTHTTQRYFWGGNSNSIDIDGVNPLNNTMTIVYSSECSIKIKIFTSVGILIGQDSLVVGNGLKKTIPLTESTSSVTVWLGGMGEPGFLELNHLILYNSAHTESRIHGGTANGNNQYSLSPVLLQGSAVGNLADGMNTFEINNNLLLVAKNTTVTVGGQPKNFVFEEWPSFYYIQSNPSWDPAAAEGCIGDTLKYKAIGSNIEALYFSRYQDIGFVSLYLPLPWTSTYSGSLGTGFEWFTTGESYLDMISIKTAHGNWLYRNQQKIESYAFEDKGVVIVCDNNSEIDLMTLNGGMSQFMYGPVGATIYTQNFVEYTNIRTTRFRANIIAKDTLYVSYHNRANQSPHCYMHMQWTIIKDRTPQPKFQKGISCNGNSGVAWMKVTNKPAGVTTSWVRHDGLTFNGDSISISANSRWRVKYLSSLGCEKWSEDSLMIQMPNSTIIPTVKLTEEVVCGIGKRVAVTYSGALEVFVTIAGVSRPISADTLIVVTSLTNIVVRAQNGCRETTVSRVIDPSEAFVVNQPFAMSWQYSACDSLVLKNGPRINKLIIFGGLNKVLQPYESFSFKESMAVRVERVGACLSGDSTFQAVMKTSPAKPVVKKVSIDVQKTTLKITFEPFGVGANGFIGQAQIVNQEIEIPLDSVSTLTVRLTNESCFKDYVLDVKYVEIDNVGLPYVNNPLYISHGDLVDGWKILIRQPYVTVESMIISTVDGKVIYTRTALLEKVSYSVNGVVIVHVSLKVLGIPTTVTQKLVFIKQ